MQFRIENNGSWTIDQTSAAHLECLSYSKNFYIVIEKWFFGVNEVRSIE